METLGRNLVEVEFHQLEMPLADSRVQDPSAQQRLTSSIKAFGQKTPGLAAQEGKTLKLLDGYQRLEALRECGKDTMWVELVSCDMTTGLLLALARNQDRHKGPLEEANLIARLVNDHGKSQGEVARALGRDPSWVSCRLKLLTGLPEPVLSAIKQGHIGPWVANRVFVPLAQANPDDAVQLLKALKHEPLSGRELGMLFKHYKTSSKQIRERVINQPQMFLRSHRASEDKREAKALREGPEGAWSEALGNLEKSLAKLSAKTKVLARTDGFNGRDDLLKAFERVASQWDQLNKTMNRRQHEINKTAGDDPDDACPGGLDREDLPNTEGVQECGAPCEEEGRDHSQAAGRIDSSRSGLDSPGLQQLQGQRGPRAGSPGGRTPSNDCLQHSNPHDSRGSP